MNEAQKFNRLLKKIKYDNDAREEFFFLYYNKLRSHIFHKYGSFPDWEDIVHDVINKLIETDWSQYQFVENPISWLYTVADNHAKDLFKKFNRISEFNEDKFSEFNIDKIDMREDLRDAMKHLKVEHQYILFAQFWQGKKLYTIAAEMGKSYVSVRVNSSRARRLLKKYL